MEGKSCQSRRKLPDEFYPGFSGKPDSSKSSLFILRSSPTSTVKNINFIFTKKQKGFYHTSVRLCVCPQTNSFVHIQRKSPKGWSSQAFTLMKNTKIPVCMSASTIFSGDWWNSLHRSPEGWLPYTYMMLIHHQKFKILFAKLFTVAVWLRHNNQFVFRAVSLTFKIVTFQITPKAKLVVAV